MGAKLRVNGIKLSQELIHINVLAQPDKVPMFTHFLTSMAENRINCPIIFYSAMDSSVLGACCVAAEDTGRLDRALALKPELKDQVVRIAPVGAISLFPHRYSLNLLGCLIHIMGQASLPVYGLTASLSSLTVTTDFELLDHAIDLLKHHIRLPAQHAPLRSDLRIRAL